MNNYLISSLLFCLYCCCSLNVLLAQNDSFGLAGENSTCGTTELQKEHMANDPQLQKVWEELEKAAYQSVLHPTKKITSDLYLTRSDSHHPR